MTTADMEINTINNIRSYEQKFPQSNQFGPNETETRQYYEREHQNYQRCYPPNRTLINSKHLVEVTMKVSTNNNPKSRI